MTKYQVELEEVIMKWKSSTRQSNRSIRNNKPNLKSHFKQGYFKVAGSNKYVGEPICIYRSGLEHQIMVWCESNPNVVAWASEPLTIPYLLGGKERNYNIDFIIMFRDGRIWFTEGKPYKQCQPYSAGWESNSAKWNAAIKWCNEQDESVNFKIITERFKFYV